MERGRETGPDFGHNALNYGLIVHAILLPQLRCRGAGRGHCEWHSQMAMELKVVAIIALSLRRISLGNLIYGIFF